MRIIVLVVTQTASTTASRLLAPSRPDLRHSQQEAKKKCNTLLERLRRGSDIPVEHKVRVRRPHDLPCRATTCSSLSTESTTRSHGVDHHHSAFVKSHLFDRADLCFGMKEFNEALCSAFKQKPGAAIRSGLRIYLAKIAFTMDTSSPRTTPTSTQAYNSCVYVTSVRMRKVILFS